MSADPLLTVSQVCRQFPGARGARRVCPSTVTRWIVAGCPARDGTRARLAATRCGGRWMIAPADLAAFFEALAGAPAAAAPRSPAERRRASDAAADRLRRRGA